MDPTVAPLIIQIRYGRFCVAMAKEWPDLRPISFNDFREQYAEMGKELKDAIEDSSKPLW